MLIIKTNMFIKYIRSVKDNKPFFLNSSKLIYKLHIDHKTGMCC